MSQTRAATKTMIATAKSQFYYNDGTGRDTYIHLDNGGFYPMKSPHIIEPVGKYPSSDFLDPALVDSPFHRLIRCD